MLSRFSKTVADLLPHKSRFFDDNEQLLARQRELAALTQALRVLGKRLVVAVEKAA